MTGLSVMAEGEQTRPPQGGVAEPARVCVGRIAGAHGVQGHVRIASYTDNPLDIAAYGPVTDADGRRSFTITPIRMAKAHVVARLKGIDDRNQAEALKGVTLFVSREALPEPEDDEFYWEDLIGLRAETVEGEALGSVLSVQDFGGGTLLEVGESHRLSVMVPFTREIVPVVDLRAGLLAIDPPAGLLRASPDDLEPDDLEPDDLGSEADAESEEEGGR